MGTVLLTTFPVISDDYSDDSGANDTVTYLRRAHFKKVYVLVARCTHDLTPDYSPIGYLLDISGANEHKCVEST